MPEVKVDSYGNLMVPETFVRHRHSALGGKYWLAEVLENIISLNEIKDELRSLHPSLVIEFVALQNNIDELAELRSWRHT